MRGPDLGRSPRFALYVRIGRYVSTLRNMEAFRWCFGERRRRRLTADPASVRRSRPPPVHWRLGGRYRLIEPVGHGGWSTVWRGHDERLGRPVAVKLLPASQAKWVRREARAVAGLTHAHIAMIFDYDC